jgi:23S rRNA (guanosine2251-2'-O)-methyltransferase
MPLYHPITLEQAIEQAYTETDNPVFVLLDGIHDPHNVGAIARSMACAGAHALLLPTQHGSPVTATAMKSSAGALHHIPIVKVPNTSVALKDCKAAGFTLIGTDMNNAQNYDSPDYDMPIVLIIGSEGSGMKNETRKLLDFSITIPLSGKVQSLNASVAAGIILFEIKRKKTII